jgi:serine/threonine protein phosphatase PrpC
VRSVGSGRTDIGIKRQSNEDAFLVDDELGLYAVADGMGGHSSGEVASVEALSALHDMVVRDRQVLTEVDRIEGWAQTPEALPREIQKAMRVLESAVQAATYMVFGLGQASPEHKGMGTTISVLLARGSVAITAQVGDSRIYRVRDNESVQITEDHTLVAWQVKKGLITADEARHSRQKNVITRAVGSREYVQVDTQLVSTRLGDTFVLCSDGLHGYIEEPEIAALVALGRDAALTRAIDMANQRGGRDNITAVIVDIRAS